MFGIPVTPVGWVAKGIGLLRKVPLWAWLALAALCVIGWQHIEISHYRSKIADVQAQSAAYVSAQQTQLATIATLQEANKRWASKDAADLALGKTYADAATQYAQQQQAQKQSAQHTIKVIYAHDPAARQWADGRVPAAIADQLHANAGNPH